MRFWAWTTGIVLWCIMLCCLVRWELLLPWASLSRAKAWQHKRCGHNAPRLLCTCELWGEQHTAFHIQHDQTVWSPLTSYIYPISTTI